MSTCLLTAVLRGHLSETLYFPPPHAELFVRKSLCVPPVYRGGGVLHLPEREHLRQLFVIQYRSVCSSPFILFMKSFISTAMNLWIFTLYFE